MPATCRFGAPLPAPPPFNNIDELLLFSLLQPLIPINKVFVDDETVSPVITIDLVIAPPTLKDGPVWPPGVLELDLCFFGDDGALPTVFRI